MKPWYMVTCNGYILPPPEQKTERMTTRMSYAQSPLSFSVVGDEWRRRPLDDATCRLAAKERLTNKANKEKTGHHMETIDRKATLIKEAESRLESYKDLQRMNHRVILAAKRGADVRNDIQLTTDLSISLDIDMGTELDLIQGTGNQDGDGRGTASGSSGQGSVRDGDDENDGVDDGDSDGDGDAEIDENYIEKEVPGHEAKGNALTGESGVSKGGSDGGISIDDQEGALIGDGDLTDVAPKGVANEDSCRSSMDLDDTLDASAPRRAEEADVTAHGHAPPNCGGQEVPL